jgi:alpha-methylacyl-CoA racemase
MSDALAGVRVVEFDGLGPAPLACRMLADMGAEVTVVARPEPGAVARQLFGASGNPWHRGKKVVVLDLKTSEGLRQALALISASDVLVEGNRPGVMERLELGPQQCLTGNPALVYGRMTGWGQHGPLAQVAGHDLNYVALTGLLSLSVPAGGTPMIPPTVVGDASGALGLAFGIACALFDARRTGRGRVVDAAIVDIVAMMGGIVQSVRAAGGIDGDRPSPFHDSPFYDTYECSDGGFVTIGALEPQFYRQLLAKLGLSDVDPEAQYDRSAWPELKQRFRTIFRSRSRDQWCALLEGTDACFAPVLSIEEAARHPHNVAREIYAIDPSGEIRVAGAPRL